MSTTTTTTIETTAPTETIPSGDITAHLNFYLPPTTSEQPYFYICPPPPGTPQTNFGDTSIPVALRDLRSTSHTFTLSTHGFSFHHIPTTLSHADFSNESKIAATYYPEIESIVKSHLPDADNVIIFDHTVRRSYPNAPREPVMRAHIDQTPRSGELRLRKHFPSAAEGVRVQIVNVWRPINGTVVSNPLALAESQSVDEEDLVPVRHIYEDYEGETAAVRYASTQRWGYLAGHTGDEVTLILCLDTKGGRRVPHTAFVHPLQQEGAKGRESIEVRCLVVGGDKGLGA